MNIKIIIYFFLAVIVLSSCKKTNDELFDEAYNLTKRKEYDKAIKVYTELIKRNRKLQLPYYNRGYCYYSKEDYSRALFDFNTVMELQTVGGFILTFNPNLPFAGEEARYQVPYYDALYQRAQINFYLEKDSASFEDFNMLIANNYVEKSNCYLWQGNIVLNNGDTAKACSYFLNSQKFANSELINQEAQKMLTKYCSLNNSR